MAISEAEKVPEFGAGTLSEFSEDIGGGIALIVLGILALAGVAPALLDSIAVIVGGVALLIEGATLSARYAKTLAWVMPGGLNLRELSGGTSAGVLAGVAGIVLGILAILEIASLALIAIAVIVFGTAVLFDYVAKAQLRALRLAGEANGEPIRIAMSAASSTNTAAILAGVSIITLGILALAHVAPAILVPAAFLALGSYLFLEGAAVTSWLHGMVTE